jgi:hypothetical protein
MDSNGVMSALRGMQASRKVGNVQEITQVLDHDSQQSEMQHGKETNSKDFASES